ncbi:hypothetical protein L1887_19011 [Cichorium endivia]|nr:hypothetical protein L1887_19011 [Cichorium endivia]
MKLKVRTTYRATSKYLQLQNLQQELFLHAPMDAILQINDETQCNFNRSAPKLQYLAIHSFLNSKATLASNFLNTRFLFNFN